MGRGIIGARDKDLSADKSKLSTTVTLCISSEHNVNTYLAVRSHIGWCIQITDAHKSAERSHSKII